MKGTLETKQEWPHHLFIGRVKVPPPLIDVKSIGADYHIHHGHNTVAFQDPPLLLAHPAYQHSEQTGFASLLHSHKAVQGSVYVGEFSTLEFILYFVPTILQHICNHSLEKRCTKVSRNHYHIETLSYPDIQTPSRSLQV